MQQKLISSKQQYFSKKKRNKIKCIMEEETKQAKVVCTE